MPIASQERILNNSRMNLPGALDDALRYIMFDVFTEFLENSSLWKETIEFSVNTDDLVYPIASSEGMIKTLVEVRDSADIPIYATMEIPGEITFTNTFTQEQDLTANVILSVSDPVQRDGWPQIPEWITQKYYTVFIDGLTGMMMAQSSKPYSNERLSIYHLRRFRNGIANAASDALKANIKGGQRWRYPRWA